MFLCGGSTECIPLVVAVPLDFAHARYMQMIAASKAAAAVFGSDLRRFRRPRLLLLLLQVHFFFFAGKNFLPASYCHQRRGKVGEESGELCSSRSMMVVFVALGTTTLGMVCRYGGKAAVRSCAHGRGSGRSCCCCGVVAKVVLW